MSFDRSPHFPAPPLCHSPPLPPSSVTVDIERFCEDLANLYTSLFKPILDIVLNAARLSAVMGVRGPAVIVAYYVVLGALFFSEI